MQIDATFCRRCLYIIKTYLSMFSIKKESFFNLPKGKCICWLKRKFCLVSFRFIKLKYNFVCFRVFPHRSRDRIVANSWTLQIYIESVDPIGTVLSFFLFFPQHNVCFIMVVGLRHLSDKNVGYILSYFDGIHTLDVNLQGSRISDYTITATVLCSNLSYIRCTWCKLMQLLADDVYSTWKQLISYCSLSILRRVWRYQRGNLNLFCRFFRTSHKPSFIN
jgi:hypothetical protein